MARVYYDQGSLLMLSSSVVDSIHGKEAVAI